MREGGRPVRFQSTHPSGVRRQGPWPPEGALTISIHAPQWGATAAGSGSARACPYFNPRTPVGCDARDGGDGEAGQISIHAPQWGATGGSNRPSGPRANFNPRTPVGCDFSVLLLMMYTHLFQSTHPSGVRHPVCTLSRSIAYFNPRTPVGCDPMFPRAAEGLKISIHAPQWGATFSFLALAPFYRFQSTHPSGVRLFQSVSKPENSVFQSTHPSGVRPQPIDLVFLRDRISIHAPQWGATT